MNGSGDRFADVSDDGSVRGYEPSFLDVDGLETRYYDVGDGDPLVLLHGGLWNGSSNANEWAPAFEDLAQHFHVLAFDRVGCGMTDNPDDVEEYRFGTELDHALAFLDAAGVESCRVCGASRGAGLAARLAVEAPNRVGALVMTNSHTFGPKAGDRSHRSERLFKPDEVSFESTDPEGFRFRYEQFSHDTDHVTDEFCRTDAYLRSRPKAHETADVMADRGEYFEETVEEHMAETRRRLAEGAFTNPALYLYGHNDMTVPLQTAVGAFEILGRANPDARLEVVNHCGHLPYRERPEEFAATVADFVDRWR